MTDDLTLERIAERLQLVEGDVARLSGTAASLGTRLESHGQALDDIESLAQESAAMARELAEAVARLGAAGGGGPGGAEQGIDIAALVAWVGDHIAQIVSRRVANTDGGPRWCRRWWEHAEAIARFEGLRRAWIALAGAPGLGLMTYFDCVDRTLAVLMAAEGPFAGCSQHAGHNPTHPVLGQEYPPELGR